MRLSKDAKTIRGMLSDGELRASAWDVLARSRNCPAPVRARFEPPAQLAAALRGATRAWQRKGR